jgi:RNA polymerase sigma factor (sigma-70 family)
MTDEQPALIATRNRDIGAAFRRERKRLGDFIRRRIRNESDAEDILQDVFQQLTAWYDESVPIVELSSWLFTVARNRIIDFYRRKRRTTERSGFGNADTAGEEDPANPDDGPESTYLRSLMCEQLAAALDELPPAQREAFVMNELEGRSFREIAELTGVPLNTLLSRKRYAVLYLRERLQNLYDEFTSQ